MTVAGTIYERDIFYGHGKLLSSQLPSNAAYVLFTSALLTSEFDNFLFDLTDVYCSVAAYLNLQGSVDDGATWATTAYYGSSFVRSDSTGGVTTAGPTNYMNIGGNQSAVGYPMGGEVFFSRRTPSFRGIMWHTTCYEGPQQIQYRGGGYYASAAINAIKFQYNAGNINGRIRLYGMRKGIIL